MKELFQDYLAKLGFNRTEIDIYAALLQFGAMPLSELSRRSSVERTALYRLIEPLTAKGLIYIQKDENRKIIHPADSSMINKIIYRQESIAAELRAHQAEFEDTVNSLKGKSTSTKVNFYHGEESIKQVMLNQLDNHKECDIHSIASCALETVVGSRFFDQWLAQLKQRDITHRVVFSKSFITSLRRTPTDQPDRQITSVEYYYLKPEDFLIKQHLDVYNDLTIYYDFSSSSDPYAVEIKNPGISATNKQLIELLIKQSSNNPLSYSQMCARYCD